MNALPMPVPVQGLNTAAIVATCQDEVRSEHDSAHLVTRQALALQDAVIRQRIADYFAAGGRHPSIGPSPFPRSVGVNATTTDGDRLYDRYTSNTALARQIIERVKGTTTGTCPYCGLELDIKPLNLSHDRDHYLPRSAFPEFSLLCVNLVIACDDCNTAKGSKIADSHGQRIFLHPYFDACLAHSLIWAEVSFPGSVPLLQFWIDPTNLSRGDIALVSRHMSELDLINRYSGRPLREMVKLLEVHRDYYRAGYALSEVRAQIASSATRELSARRNSPLGHLLAAASNAPDLGVFMSAGP